MKSYEDLESIAAKLPPMTFEEKVLFVSALGLRPAYCPECNCTIGSPWCHPDTVADVCFQDEGCPSLCPLSIEEDA